MSVDYAWPLPEAKTYCVQFVLSVSSLLLSVMVRSCHVLTLVIFAPGFLYTDAALWQ